MGKYIKKFATQAAYTTAQATFDLPNVSLITENMTVEFNPYVEPQAPGNIITYGASAKLTETTSFKNGGLHTNAFNTTITSHTFENGVGTIEFAEDVTSIGNQAFKGCSSLTSVTIPNSVTTIGDNAFDSCSGLTSIGGVGSGASLEIPSSVTSTGRRTFGGCSSLTSVTIPSSITSISPSAFEGCSDLTSVTIPSSVTSISTSAFNQCESLMSVTIPSSVTSISTSAFINCTALSSVTVNATTPPTLGSDAFYANASSRKIYVPSESVDTYKSASGWSDYANDIYAIGS